MPYSVCVPSHTPFDKIIIQGPVFQLLFGRGGWMQQCFVDEHVKSIQLRIESDCHCDRLGHLELHHTSQHAVESLHHDGVGVKGAYSHASLVSSSNAVSHITLILLSQAD